MFNTALGELARLAALVEQIPSRWSRPSHAKMQEANRRLKAVIATLRAERAELERAQAALRHAQKMETVGKLTGGVAHDFNNLLTIIVGNLEMLRARVAPEHLRFVERAEQGAQRGAYLTAQLLAFARKQTLIPVPTRPHELVCNMGSLLDSTLGSAVTVVTESVPDLWRVTVDAAQLQTAILNLALNAKEAMPNGSGRITLRTSNVVLQAGAFPNDEALDAGEYVRIGVTDDGRGMTAEVAARAFDPFFTTKPMGCSSSGLGLSQVYGFVRQSRGHVTIASMPGHGTTVCIYLPRSTPEERAAADADDACPQPQVSVSGKA